jgi:hypothetical protein
MPGLVDAVRVAASGIQTSLGCCFATAAETVLVHVCGMQQLSISSTAIELLAKSAKAGTGPPVLV